MRIAGADHGAMRRVGRQLAGMLFATRQLTNKTRGHADWAPDDGIVFLRSRLWASGTYPTGGGLRHARSMWLHGSPDRAFSVTSRHPFHLHVASLLDGRESLDGASMCWRATIVSTTTTTSRATGIGDRCAIAISRSPTPEPHRAGRDMQHAPQLPCYRRYAILEDRAKDCDAASSSVPSARSQIRLPRRQPKCVEGILDRRGVDLPKLPRRAYAESSSGGNIDVIVACVVIADMIAARIGDTPEAR